MYIATPAMKQMGVVLHQAGSGRVIIRLNGEASEGDILCNSQGVRVARIREVIGPVRAPYASAEPLTNNIQRHMGEPVSICNRGKKH